MIRKINSHTNSLVKHVVQLHSAKHRAIHQEFIAEGLRTITTIINAHHKPLLLFVLEELVSQAQQLAPHDAIVIVASSVMKKISASQSPSGMLATFKIPSQPSIINLNAGIVLAQLSDPGNVGTLIRTAAAMNKKTIVCIDGVDIWSPKVVQASAGAIGHVTIFSLTWDALLHNKKNLNLYALTAIQGKNPRSIDLSNALIVVGNEGHGIPDEWIAQCDERITLAMPGKFESLNAAVAGSIALYLCSN